MKYVWLNIETGQFSNSWGDDEMKLLTEDEIKNAINSGYRLIKYECLNDSSFEFYHQMKLK